MPRVVVTRSLILALVWHRVRAGFTNEETQIDAGRPLARADAD
jgi:hypothetical protein